MGHENKGREYFIRSIMQHQLSPFELSVFKGIWFGMKTWPRRIRESLWAWPFPIVSYIILDWADKENWKTHRKNPKDFENDE